MPAHVLALARDDLHRVSKQPCARVRLIAGLGVEGDAHAGLTMQHRSRWVKQRTVPNLRQVHLIHAELFDELYAKGFVIAPARMGENVTTRGIDLLGLSAGTRLRLGTRAVIELTGLRNPCFKLDGIAPGLMGAVLEKGAGKTLIRKAGVMAVVVASGEVGIGDPVTIATVPPILVPLKPV
ncbi:MOSC domain-containing protein [Novosphingobium sp. Gsoil 351]|uniref:MOSC domain-containing protein n=1 Tax=Novosphingobium sp. Gsoil 351 TaxID=2675225 RepID=UPI0012B44B00|nr:MOSC domain-containing protein [Novosphingobium sp. Gsoil 351]QGN53377.1 MOSC domain-containing protein [Novosphingobium sp. Gsoil 351]